MVPVSPKTSLIELIVTVLFLIALGIGIATIGLLLDAVL